MDTFRKWLNKPKADDKSLLAQFYHADRSLTAVASELDSFDGRAEPDRCSRLVSRLRRGQDHVLAITNQIMEELLGEDRDPRSFRAKFPEEVLQENLAGQLWFGAECLAAGSSIMNREEESKEMRPLAQAVTKSLDIVRNLLRDQCLRNNVPNSKTLHLDLNDSNTEQLYESLKIFDRLFAEFELRYVSAMVQVKTKHEYEMQELICVLFSETLQRALTLGLIEQDKVDAFDPALMFSIPRLAIIAGLVVYPKGPLNLEMPADQLSEMFRPFRMILIKIRDLLNTLSRQDLLQLERLLCTTEDHTKIPLGTSSIEAPSAGDQANNNTTTSSSVQITEVSQSSVEKLSNNRDQRERELVEESSAVGVSNRSPSISPVYADISPHSTPASSPSHSPTPSHSLASTTSVSTESTNSAVDWTDDEEDDDDDEDDDEDAVDDIDTSDDEAGETLPKDIVSADCASGYLIPNTNFGNLLQPQEAPLTDNFIANDSEFLSDELFLDAEDRPTTSSAITATRQSLQRLQVPSSYDDDDDAQQQQHETINNNNNTQQPSDNNGNNNQQPSSSPNSISISSRSSSQRQQSGCDSAAHCSRSSPTTATEGNKRPHRHHHHHHHHRHHNHSHHHHHHHHHHPHPHRRSTGHHTTKEQSEQPATAAVQSNTENLDKKITTIIQQQETSSVDSSISSTSSDGDAQDVALAVRTANRRMFKSSDNLLHRLFVCIAGVADQLQTNFASDLRHILRSVFLMNMSMAQDDIEIPEKQKESELFEFRASENDVIQESAGSNQSIYSAEEVNPELDNVFNNNNSNNNNISNSSSNSSFNHQRSSNERQSSTMQRNNTIELGGGSANEPASSIRNQVGRSRSLGDHDSNDQAATTAANSQASINNSYNRRLSSSSSSTTAAATGSQQQYHHQHRNRNNSVGSNSNSSLSSSSETNSPVSERNNNSSSIATSSRQSSAGSTTTLMSPPAWIPDGKAPRCMACQTSFTPFRRRHHCRNCGGVFCGVCSNATAPLPKYGLTKAVRVCRECFVREGRTNGGSAVQQRNSIATATAGGS